MEKFEVIKLEINKLTLTPADVLVIRLKQGTPSPTVHEVEDYVRGILPPKVKFMVVSDAVELSVIRGKTEKK